MEIWTTHPNEIQFEWHTTVCTYGAHIEDQEDISSNYDGENQILCRSRLEFLDSNDGTQL